jgi:D-alanyl-D-alanine carboxypeptidase
MNDVRICARSLAAACIASVLVRAPLSAAPPDATEIERLVSKTMEEKRFVGLSVGVMHEGRVVLAKAWGVRSPVTKEPVAPETPFAIGSVTKEFTCAAALLLQEEGKLSLDDPVARSFSDLTSAGEITLRDVGGHVSGYRDYYPLDFVDRVIGAPRAADDIVRDYARRPLDFPHGTRWSYSNTGFLILGRAVEKAAGEGIGETFAKRILGPLRLAHTIYEPAAETPGLAQGWTALFLGPPERAIPEGKGWAGAAGGLWSTPSDLLAWDLALIDGKLLSKASYVAMTTPHRLPDGRSTGYGCGLAVRDRGPALVLHHGGAVSGFVAQNAFVPSTRSAVVLLANFDGAPLDELRDAILEKLMPATEAPAIAGPPALEAALDFLKRLREGTVDKSRLSDEFAAYLTPARLATAKASLSALGEPKDVKVESRRERGGMEVASLRFTLGGIPVAADMYRAPDGKIEQLLVFRR